MVEEFILSNEEELLKVAENIGKTIKGKEIICLIGDLGSGKTTFVKGIAKGMGIKEGFYVRSPTFTIVNEYPTEKGKLIHIDLYRDKEFNIREFSGEGIIAIEWADSIKCCDIIVKIEYIPEGRKVTILYNNGHTKKGYGKT